MADVEKEGKSGASGGANFDFTQLMQGAQRDIDHRVQDRLQKGEFVPPENFPSTQDRAMSALAHQLPSNYLHSGGPTGLYDRGSSGKDFYIGGDKDPGMTMRSPGMGTYIDRANASGQGIDKQEENIANRLWSDKTPAERDQIEAEYKNRDIYFNNGKAPTPHLDAFIGEVTKQIQPLEEQREAQLRHVFQQLPDEAKLAIYRHQEERKSFQFK
ncbi:MAG TPA: hypothetical protein V6D22_24925 [Candidatus Obscuribacterales bacterium]